MTPVVLEREEAIGAWVKRGGKLKKRGKEEVFALVIVESSTDERTLL